MPKMVAPRPLGLGGLHAFQYRFNMSKQNIGAGLRNQIKSRTAKYWAWKFKLL
jgi:hypothetical protein